MTDRARELAEALANDTWVEEPVREVCRKLITKWTKETPNTEETILLIETAPEGERIPGQPARRMADTRLVQRQDYVDWTARHTGIRCLFITEEEKMGTKNNPAEYDCYANALPDEPIFIFLARDLSAPLCVEAWATYRKRAIALGFKPISDMAMVDEALQCANNMREWRKKNDGVWRHASELERANVNPAGTQQR